MPLPRPLIDGGRAGLTIDIRDLGPTKTVLNADGTVNYVEVTLNSTVYRRTYSYPDNLTTLASDWTAQ